MKAMGSISNSTENKEVYQEQKNLGFTPNNRTA
jgi:hypothetical protein